MPRSKRPSRLRGAIPPAFTRGAGLLCLCRRNRGGGAGRTRGHRGDQNARRPRSPGRQIHPDNLWALSGLLDCLNRGGEPAEAALVRQRVDLAAARADLPVSVSCFCARGSAA
jgi:hypothetical protein